MSYYVQIFDPPGQTRDCVHGQHARKCPICGLERELHDWKQCAEGLAKSCQYMGTTDAERVMILTEKDRALACFNKLKGQ